MVFISDIIGRLYSDSNTNKATTTVNVIPVLGLSYACCPLDGSGSSIPQKPHLHYPALQSNGFDYLWVSWY